MNILKRTHGIDSKARSGALMGICEVVFKDAISGKVTDKEVKKNMRPRVVATSFNNIIEEFFATHDGLDAHVEGRLEVY